MMRFTSGVCAAVMAVAMSGMVARAQTSAGVQGAQVTFNANAKEVPRQPCNPTDAVQKTYYLTSVTQVNDGNEILTALRNLLQSCDRLFMVPSRNAIIMQATPDQIALAEKLLGELDRPKKTYRLTYTISELDGTKRVDSQKFALVVADGQRTQMKQGSKVPVATSSNSATQTQYTYFDVGMNFDVTASELGNGATLKTRVEQSSVADEKAIAGVQEPVIRQASLEGTSFVLPGKPLMLGSMEVAGSTRHLEVEVTMEVVQ